MQDSGETSRLIDTADACCLALIAALICALPTVLRAGTAGGGALDAFLTATAVLLCILAPLALLIPKAARGWRGVVGQTTPRRLIAGLILWVVLSGALFAFLGTFLKAKTHHRGLGGATFGVFACASAVIVAVVVARAMQRARELEGRPAWRWPVRIAGALAVVIALGVVGVPLVSHGGGEAQYARAAIFDLLLCAVVVSVLIARRPGEGRGALRRLPRAVRLTAVPVVVAIAVLGFVRVETAHAAVAVRQSGGVVATILNALERWTDRDGDGVGSHFGGTDCDEGDPARRPGLEDVAGDGIDRNCDGHDGVLESPRVATTSPSPPPAETVTAASAATVVASAPVTPKTPDLPKQPDIIIVTLDTVRADHTSVYGYDKNTTPHLAKLAARGVVFEHAYAAGSTTQRALMPIVSGTTMSATPHTNKEWPRIEDEANTVAERMKAAGYATGGVSSFTWIRGDRGFDQGFDEFDQSAWKDRHPERDITGDLAIDAAIRLYTKMSKEAAPLYLWVHLFDAHAKYLEHAAHDFGKGLSGRYDGEIAFVDEQLSRLFAAVEAGPRKGKTAWFIHGSHGEAFGEHGQTGHGSQLYDESIRVPLIVAAPWVKPGRFNTDAVSILDVAPTVLDLAGASAEKTTGLSLRPALVGDTFERPPVLAYANRRVTVVDWPMKLHVFRRDERRDRLHLFDLTADPGEEKDISADHRETLQSLDAVRQTADESGGER